MKRNVKFCSISTFNKILVNTLSGLPRVFDLKKSNNQTRGGKIQYLITHGTCILLSLIIYFK